MTTALMKQTVPVVRTRVAWVSRMHATPTTLFDSRADELVHFVDWQGLDAAKVGSFDLVLCDSVASAQVPAGMEVAVLVITEGESPNGPTSMDRSTLESCLDALLAVSRGVADLRSEIQQLRQLTAGVRTGEALHGNTPVIRRLHGAIRRAADCDVTVLIEGAQGSGKSLAARVIHSKSRRAGSAPTVLDAGSANGESLTKAIEGAAKSTLIVENVDRLPAAAQSLLVRHIKERSSQGHGPRLIVTTAAHLPELVAKGAFREDLYYRLHAFPLTMPSLRERMDDLPGIVRNLMDSSTWSGSRGSAGITPSAVMLLESMQWPGNVAQLEAVLHRAFLQAGGGTIDRDHLSATPMDVAQVSDRPTKAREEEETEASIRPFEEEEKLLLSRALRATKGNVRRAAQLLNIGRATLYRKIQQYQLRLQ